MEGEGLFKCKDENKYEISFKDNKKNGFGMFYLIIKFILIIGKILN